MGWGVGISAAAAAIGAGYGVYAGERTNQQQKRARTAQEQAQRASLLQTASQKRENDMAAAKAAAKAPNVDSLLASNTLSRAPSLLSGTFGVDPSMLTLGRPKLLGE